jgi:hypothetical protein
MRNRTQLAIPAGSGQAAGLILDYQPRQITGWGDLYGFTLGGHVASSEFTFQHTAYQVNLMSFGQAGNSPDPVYEDIPADLTVDFQQTLTSTWGAYYSFRYLGGRGAFSVQSYSVFANTPSASAAGFGGDLYLVYQPGGGGHPAIDDQLQFIQVTSSTSGAPGSALVSAVDDSGRDNPFYGEGGGLISVHGTVSVSFYDRPNRGIDSKIPISLAPVSWMAEVFLAQDTGVKDATGKDVVNIYGGVKWGWQVQSA